MTSKSSILTVEDRLELLDLLARYNHLFEERRAEEWAELFIPDGVFDGPAGLATGHKELAELCNATTAKYPVALHFTDHHQFDWFGDEVRHMCLLSVQFPTNKGVQTLLYRYRDVLVKDRSSTWKFKIRRVVAPDDIGWPPPDA